MTFFPNNKNILEITLGGLDIKIAWYAVLILGGAILAYQLSLRTAKKLGYDKNVLEDFFFTVLPVAIIGARLYYCFFEWSRFSADPISVLYVWEGGLAFHGGLFAALIYAFFYFRYKGINLLRVGDCIMPNILIAQAIGRWGNFANQEAYGQIVNENHFNLFPDFITDQMFIDGAYRQPMFLYESIGNIIGFILIKTLFKKYGYKKRGDMIYAYVAWYGIVRFFVEIFRSDALMFMGLKTAQMISLIFLLVGILGYMGVYNKIFNKFYPFKKDKPIVLFDVDGTLIDSEQLIRDSFIHTFAHFMPTHKLSDDELHSFMGPTLVETFEKYLVAEQVEAAVDYYRDYNHEKHDEVVKEMKHAKELVVYLKSEGYTIGAVSNKMTPLVKRGLACCGLEEYMDVIVGRDQVVNAKPDPESLKYACQLAQYPVDDIIYVGDATSDVIAAKRIGAYSIAYSTNELSEKLLSESNPCALIHDLMEIKDILKEEFEWNVFVI